MALHIAARRNSRVSVMGLTPSVNLTPMGNTISPVPYPVQENFSPASSVSSNVNFNRDPAFHAGSNTSQVTGDAAGSAGGIKSGTVGGKSTAIPQVSGSATVFINGQRSIREGDVMYMQNENNTGKVQVTPPVVAPTITDEGKVPASEWEKAWIAFNDYVPVEAAYSRMSNPAWWKKLPDDLMTYGEELYEGAVVAIDARITTAKEVYQMVDEHIKAMKEDGVFKDPTQAFLTGVGDLKTVMREVMAERQAILQAEVEGVVGSIDETAAKIGAEIDATTDKFSQGEYGTMAGAAVGQAVTALWEVAEPRKKFKLGVKALSLSVRKEIDGMLNGMKKALAKLREERKHKKRKDNDENGGSQVLGHCNV